MKSKPLRGIITYWELREHFPLFRSGNVQQGAALLRGGARLHPRHRLHDPDRLAQSQDLGKLPPPPHPPRQERPGRAGARHERVAPVT